MPNRRNAAGAFVRAAERVRRPVTGRGIAGRGNAARIRSIEELTPPAPIIRRRRRRRTI